MNAEVTSAHGDTAEPSQDVQQDDNQPVESKDEQSSIWYRLAFMFLVTLIYGISRAVVALVVLIQFLYVLFTDNTNARLLELSESLATYTYQIIRYLTFGTERRPYPFDLGWPTGPPEAGR